MDLNLPEGEGESPPTMLNCIFCKATIFFPGLPATRYRTHLFNEHNVMHEVELVIQWTLRQQAPHLADPVQCQCPRAKEGSTIVRADENDQVATFEPTPATTDSSVIDVAASIQNVERVQECLVCDDTFKSKNDLDKHVQVHHSQRPSRTSLFKCKICDFRGPNSNRIVSEHISGKHNLSIKDYKDTCVKRHMKILMPNILDSPKTNKVANAIMVKQEHYNAVEEESEHPMVVAYNIKQELATAYQQLEIDSIQNYSIQIDSVQNDSIVNESNEDIIEFQAPWYCGTLLECHFCKCQFFESAELKKHLAQSHDTSLEEAVATHGDMTVTSNVHECCICGKGIMHSHKKIQQHLYCHNINMTQYYEQHKEDIDNDKLLLPITDRSLMRRISRAFALKGSDSAPLNPSMSKFIDHDFNKWINRCTFACRICTFIGTCYNMFINHIRAAHQMTGTVYGEEQGKMCTATVQHTCQICGGLMAWDRGYIAKHLTLKHNSISINDYYLEYKDKYTDTPNLEDDEKEEWMNQCIFACKECPKAQYFNTRNKLLLHLSLEHGMSNQEYQDKHKSLFASFINHICKVCDKRVRWDKDNIIAHLARFHSLTPEKYVSEYFNGDIQSIIPHKMKKVRGFKGHSVSNQVTTMSSFFQFFDKCSFACKICHSIFDCKDSFRTHLGVDHKMTELYHSGTFGSEIFEKVSHSCMVCDLSVLFDSTSMKKHLKRNHKKMTLATYKADYLDKYSLAECAVVESNDWMNQCLSYCKICSNIFRGKALFKRHIASDHNLGFNDYTEAYGNGYYEEVMHICQAQNNHGKACSQEIIWDKQTLTYHLGKHNLTPESYHSDYMTDYKGNLQDNFKKDLDNWGNKCTFLCSVCNKIFDKKSNLLMHLKDEHEIEQIEDLVRIVVQYVLHTCQICKENLLWEEETLTDHLLNHHGVSKDDYANMYIEKYQESASCSEEIYAFDNWINRCVFKCMLCNKGQTFNKKQNLFNHLTQHHSQDKTDYFIRFAHETFVDEVFHICQICTKEVHWDCWTLLRHIENTHHMKSKVYRAKYMSIYTEDIQQIEELRKEENKVAKSTKKTRSRPQPGQQNNPRSMSFMSGDYMYDFEEDEHGVTWNDEVRTWARGCLYNCEICGADFIGAQAFEAHLDFVHQTTLTIYRKKSKGNQSCVLVGYHFCKLCCCNIRHDEEDLKAHFKKEHNMSVVKYYEQYKSKLKMPRLTRPPTTSTPNDKTPKETTNRRKRSSDGEKGESSPASKKKSPKNSTPKIKVDFNKSTPVEEVEEESQTPIIIENSVSLLNENLTQFKQELQDLIDE